MSNDVTPEELDAFWKEFGEWAERAVMPQMRGSFCTVVVVDHGIDIALCFQLGAAILLEKPLIIMASKGAWIPPKLRRIADVVLDSEDMSTAEGLRSMKLALKEAAMQRMADRKKQ